MNTDKVTIGLTQNGRRIMDQITEREWFDDQISIAKFAVAVAISAGKKPAIIEKADTVWNIGSFDREGELRTLITALFPDVSSPYRAIEFYINSGLEIIGNVLQGNMTLTELLESFGC